MDCSHEWSDAVWGVAEPVEEVVCSSRPGGQPRELNGSGPTGRNKKAQGNALGNESIAKMSPERAKQSAQFTALPGGAEEFRPKATAMPGTTSRILLPVV